MMHSCLAEFPYTAQLPSPSHLAEAGLRAVDPHDADLQRLRHALAALRVGADDGAREAKLAVVGGRHRLCLGLKRRDWSVWTIVCLSVSTEPVQVAGTQRCEAATPRHRTKHSSQW